MAAIWSVVARRAGLTRLGFAVGLGSLAVIELLVMGVLQ
jgi:hypothetical protein